MNFFNIDCHISVIADIKNIFEDLGHKVDSWSLSGHKWVFNLPNCPSEIINENNWKNLNEEMVEIFYKFHKDELDKYDAFICAYPPCFLKLFEKFNKPIIVIAATRYDYPFADDPKRLAWLEESLNNNKNLILVANNQFDQKYCELFLEKKWQWIPSLCKYTNSKYKPIKNQSIIFSKFLIDFNNHDFIHQSKIHQYSWDELYSYQSIIHLPYNVSTMSIFEQYEAGVPLNFPSLEYAIELINNKIPLFSEIVFPNNNPDRQPNLFLNKKWLSYSDFYNGTIKASFFQLDNIKKPEINIDYQSNKDIIYSLWTKILNEL
jgi:hypothetical protein